MTRGTAWACGWPEFASAQNKTADPDKKPVEPPLAGKHFKNSLGMEFALVPKGKSWLGGENGKEGRRK